MSNSALEWFIARVNARMEQESAYQAQLEVHNILTEQARARVVSERDGRYRVMIMQSSDPERVGSSYVLLREEIEFDAIEIGTEGTLVWRDDGFYVTQHLIPDPPTESGLSRAA